MIDTSTQTAIAVTTSVMDARAVDIARDFLAGYTGDYFFFQSSQFNEHFPLIPTEYILITGTDFEIDDETGYIITGDSFTVFDITQSIPSSSVESYPISGHIIGIEDGVAIEDFNGSMQRTVIDSVTQWITQVYTVDRSISFDVSASGGGEMLVYSSFGQHPRLISGGDHFAFYISLLLSVSFVVGIFGGIWRKISN